MKRLLTAGIFGTILGIVGAGTAKASIVSSGFLDEKLTEYALSTSLDLKANQTDLTALSNKIGTLPDGLTVANLYDGWTISNGEYINGLSIIAQDGFTTYDPLADELRSGRKTESGGYLNVLARLLFDDGYYQAENSVLAPFWYLTKQSMRVGEIPHGKTAAGMIDEINTKIGTLPEGITVQGMYEGWTDSNKITYSGLNTISQDYAAILDAFGTSGLTSLFLKGGTITIPGYSTNTILPYPELSYGVSKIGDLPSGNFPEFPYHEFLSDIGQPLTYPTSLAELITAIYGNSETSQMGLLAAIIAGFPFDTDGDGIDDLHVGLLPNFTLARNANDLANATVTKVNSILTDIGTLPAGYDSVGAALTAIKGIAEDAKAAALAAIPDPKQEGSSGKFVLTVDIVGDNATYHWEKIDREGETTTTTE